MTLVSVDGRSLALLSLGENTAEARRQADRAEAAVAGIEAADHAYTGTNTFAEDIGLGAAVAGRTGNNYRFGYLTIPYTVDGEHNIGVGDETLRNLEIGNGNIGLGNRAGRELINGSYNFIAVYAGIALEEGSSNILIGVETANQSVHLESCIGLGPYALEDAQDCENVIGIGLGAGRRWQGQIGSVAIGFNSQQFTTTGAGGTSVGHNALAANTTGIFNSAFGPESLVANVIGNHNSAYAAYSLDANEGDRNNGFGYQSGYRQKNGDDNFFGGFQCGRGEDVGGVATYYDAFRNAFIGNEAFRQPQDGANDNAGVGYRAGYGITTATGAALLGSGAGSLLTTGDNCIVIGKDQQADSATNDNQINVGGRFFHDRIRLLERSADPVEPTEGNCVLWMSDGTGKGDDGDVIIAAKAGGVTKYSILFDHSAGTAWAA